MMRMGGTFRSIGRRMMSTTKSMVEVEKKSSYAIVRLNRPPVNSLNTALLQELESTIKELEEDKSVRGMILASTNQKIFTAGLDILHLYDPKRDELFQFWTALQDLYLRLYLSPLATVAAIEGHSPAGGCLLSICCDYRIMATGGPLIGLNETKLGIVAPFWFGDTFVNTIGQRQAEKMLGLGMQVPAEEAARIGLVDEALPLDQVFPRSESAIQEWLAIPDAARQASKLSRREATAQKLKDHRESDFETIFDFASRPSVVELVGKYLSSLKKGKK